LFGGLPGGYGFFEQVTFICGTEKLTAWVLITIPKGSVLCGGLSSWFTV
jgi:hypothetical protein